MSTEAVPVPSSRAPSSGRARAWLPRVSARGWLGIAAGCLVCAVLSIFVWARLSFPSDHTPRGAYLRVVIAVNRGHAEDLFAYTETRAQHACYTIRDYRKKTRERVLASSKAATSAHAENKNNAVAAGSPAAGEQLTASASN